MSAKGIAGVSFAAIGAIASGIWAADSHWARASDMRSLADTIVKQIEINRLASEANTLELRRAAVLDKLQDGEAKGTRVPAEKAILERYNREREFVERQLRDKNRQIDQLRAK